jgi:septum formation protein
MTKIILASASPRRADLLRQLGLAFNTVNSGVAEEDNNEKDPLRLAAALALSKAMAVAPSVEEGVVCVDGELLGKPADTAEAMAMLRRLSGRCHRVVTGMAVIRQPQRLILQHTEQTTVCMRPISEEEIRWYINSGEPFDKAGGYGIQGKAAVFVERLEGCYFNVVGLPLSALCRMLAETGVRIWEGAEKYDIKAPDHQGSATE